MIPRHKATIKRAGDDEVRMTLYRIEPRVFRWVLDHPALGRSEKFDGVDYLSEHDAIRGARVTIEAEPLFVGYDLTIIPVEPPAEERAAKAILDIVARTYVERFAGAHTNQLCRGAGCPPDCTCLCHNASSSELAQFSAIIREETNLPAVLEAVQSLIAFCFTRRAAFAQALFPSQKGQKPRDITFDGLLLEAIQAIGKATKQDHANLVQILMEPVSSIVMPMPGNMPKGGIVQ